MLRSLPGLLVRSYVRFITKKPLITVIGVILITAFLMLHAIDFKRHISSDLEIYLPKGAEESRTMREIARHWATDLVIIYIETDNAFYPEDFKTNITDKRVLDEISWIEGDDFWPGLNFKRGDRGRYDGIAYVVSISILIKELNSSGPRMANVLEKEMADELADILGAEAVNVSVDDPYAKEFGHYAIPDDQRQIDELVRQIPENVLNSLVADTNDDGIWDTAYIMFGVIREVDDAEMRGRVDSAIDNRPSKLTKMTQTGIIAIMLDVTEEAYEQLMFTLPFSILFTVAIIVFFHRTLKILLITGLPLFFTLIWTTGLIVLLDLRVSPIIVAAVPMLVGLCVDYSLHLANRIAEFKREQHEEVHRAVVNSISTTGRAILLSAVTTIVGFAALLISPLQPIEIMGLALVIGISSAFILTMILVPNLVILLNYRKVPLAGWKTISKYPVRFRWPVVIAVVLVTIISLANLKYMLETPKERPKERNYGIPSITYIRKFSRLWASGQSALLLIEGDYPGVLNDTPILDSIDYLETGINEVRLVNATSIVDLFKSVQLNVSWYTAESRFNESFIPPVLKPIWNQIKRFIGENTQEYYWSVTYWDFIHWLPDGDLRRRAIRIFYDSLTDEMRTMLMNEDFSMTLMIINFPYLGLGETERIINDINDVVDERGDLRGGRASKASGITALMLVANRAVVESQKSTILISLIFVFIALTLIFLSPRIASITMIPILIVVAWQPLTMVGVSQFTGGATLNMMTAMIGSIIIGTGIDYAVHISERVREEGETIKGVMTATEHTGQSIAEATFTTVAGLSGGLFVTWFRGFFFIVIALLLYAMFAGLVVLPAVYAIYIRCMERRYRRYLAEEEVYEVEPLE